ALCPANSILWLPAAGLFGAVCRFCIPSFLPLRIAGITAVFMLVDHCRDALMQRPYKALVMAM
ncbi:MAG: hypothetical protein O4749_06120, partial [Trichodesmium sp. St5_bin2_1]|nr:hypothetical protein [Trichodesmium sp. St5_bin2_1]